MEVDLTPDELLHLAIVDSRNGRHDEAIVKLKRCIAASPSQPGAYHMLAAEHAEMGMVPEAISEFSEAIRLDPSSVPARFQLGLLRALNNQPEQARPPRTLARVGLEAIALLRDYRLMSTHKRQEAHLFSLYLAGVIRQALDWYTLNYSSNAPDVVLMQLLEAQYTRIAGGLDDEDHGEGSMLLRTRTAPSFITTAEQHLMSFRFRPVLRLRLLMERCASLRAAAAAEKKADPRNALRGIDRAQRLCQLAEYDAQQFENLVEAMFPAANEKVKYGVFWRCIADRELAATKALTKELRQ